MNGSYKVVVAPRLAGAFEAWSPGGHHLLKRRHGISPAIATEVASLPDSFHRDPADRILVATALVLGATLLTQDRRIVDAALTDTLS